MAILKSVICNGSARILNKLYCNDFQVSGTASFAAITATGAISGASLTTTGAATIGGNATVSGTLGVTGAATFSSTLNATGDITSTANLSATGGYLYLASNAVMDGGKTTQNQLTINNNSTFSNGTYVKGILRTDNLISSSASFSGDVTVNGVLNSTEMQTNIVKAVGGQLYVSPTYVATTGEVSGTTRATISCTQATSDYVWFTISDASAIEGLTYGGANWYSGSKIMFTGTVKANLGGQPDIVFASSDGELTANMNSTSYTVQIKVKYAGASTYFSDAGTNLTWSDISVMMYKINNSGTLYPVGVYIKAYGNDNKNSYIDIYGGTTTTPNARLGLLTGAPSLNNGTTTITPSGWGIYTNNGYFDGVLVSSSGKIGDFTLTDKLLAGTWGVSGSVLVSAGYSPTGADAVSIGGSAATGNTWAFVAGTAFGVTNAGALYASSATISGKITAGANSIIGPWNISSTAIYKVSSTMGSSSSGAAYFGNDGLSITDKFKVSSQGLLQANGASISGTINSEIGRIGGWDILNQGLYSTLTVDGTKTDIIFRNGLITSAISPSDITTSNCTVSVSDNKLYVTPTATGTVSIGINIPVEETGEYKMILTGDEWCYGNATISYTDNSMQVLMYTPGSMAQFTKPYNVEYFDVNITKAVTNNAFTYTLSFGGTSDNVGTDIGFDIKLYKDDELYGVISTDSAYTSGLPSNTVMAIKKTVGTSSVVPYLLQADGTLTLTSANISGTIHAASGSTFGDTTKSYLAIGDAALDMYYNNTAMFHFGYGQGTDSLGNTTVAPYYTLGTRASNSNIGNYSLSLGSNNTSSYFASYAEGFSNTASNYCAHAEGYSTVAEGDCSHAQNYNTTAHGMYSSADGNGTYAQNHASHASGSGTIAAYDSQTVIGRYNTYTLGQDKNGNPIYVTGAYSFIIGNGTDDNNRSDALTLDTSGNLVTAGAITSGGNLSVTGTITCTGGITSNGSAVLRRSDVNSLAQHVIIQMRDVTLTSSGGVAANSEGTVTGTVTVTTDATGYWVMPTATYNWNICTSSPTYTVSGNNVNISCTVWNNSSGSHTMGVRCRVFSYKTVNGVTF